MKFNVLVAAALTLGCALSTQAAIVTHTVVTQAKANSTGTTNGGVGADTFFSLTQGEDFTISTTGTWSGATDTTVFNGGADGTGYYWVNLNAGKADEFHAAVGALVGEINGDYQLIGAGTHTIAAWATGELKLQYADVNMDDNSGHVTSDVTAAIPEPTNVALLLAGLGMMGVVARRRSQQ